MRRVGTLFVGFVLVAALAGCGGDDDGGGDDASSDGAATTAAAGEFALSSPAFEAGTEIPVEFSCEGDDVSPPLDIAGAPEDADTLAIALTDPDAGGFVHWLATGMAPGTTTIPQGGPTEAAQFLNGFGVEGYRGPCPPPGEEHGYVFTVYAVPPDLAVPLTLEAGPVLEALEGSDAPSATLEATFATAAS